jgi:hypothetical protein
LDEYQAFNLDGALAHRYNTLEKEDFARAMHEIREAIKLTGRYQGAKHIKYRKFKSDLGDTHDDDGLDDDEGVYTGGSGRGTAIE